MKILFAIPLFAVSLFGQAQTGGTDATGRMNLAGQPFTISLPNSATGTTLNKLAKAVVTGGVLQAQIITTSAADQASVIGCVVSGAGTSGSALIVVVGTASCYFDAATTAGHIAVPSSTSAGALHDSGSTSTNTLAAEVLATVGATNACGSPPCLIAGNVFMTPDLVAQGSQGNGGGGGPPPPKAAQQIRTCEIVIGDPGAASSALADDNDTPSVCVNDTTATMTITAVKCYANAGSPTVTPIITGGGATSILSGALTCGTGSYATGSLNGTPTETAGQTIDGNITTAGGTAKYIVIRISRTL